MSLNNPSPKKLAQLAARRRKRLAAQAQAEADRQANEQRPHTIGLPYLFPKGALDRFYASTDPDRRRAPESDDTERNPATGPKE